MFVVSCGDDGGPLSRQEMEQYHAEGYLVKRGLWSEALVAQVKREIHSIVDAHFENIGEPGYHKRPDHEEVVSVVPGWASRAVDVASLEQRLALTRRIFRPSIHNTMFSELCRHGALLGAAKQLLDTEDLKILQSMCLLKPPNSGEKHWHQDNAYFRVTPNRVLGVWIAICQTTVQNGCMHVVPRSHTHGIENHASKSGEHSTYSVVENPPPEDVVPIPMEPGDVLFFHGEILHYTPDNVTREVREAVQLHYAWSGCQPTECPDQDERAKEELRKAREGQHPINFDCAPCIEPQFWAYRKAEILISGRDFGDPCI